MIFKKNRNLYMVPLCILVYILSEANIEILLNKSVMGWDIFLSPFQSLVSYTIVEKVTKTFLCLDFLCLTPNSIENKK